jgi:hypothetical protein
MVSDFWVFDGFRLRHATDASTVATGINRLIRALESS